MFALHDLPQTILALSIVFGAGVCCYPFLRLPRAWRGLALAFLAIPVFLAPLLVPLPMTGLRLIVFLAAITVGVKFYDLHHAVEAGPPPRFRLFLAYLPNGCDLVLRRVAPPDSSQRTTEVVRLVWLIAATAFCAIAIYFLWQFSGPAYPWLFEHCAKVIAVCAFIQFGTNIIACFWRLIGVPALDFSGWFFAAATPAEFWRRWNSRRGNSCGNTSLMLSAERTACPWR